MVHFYLKKKSYVARHMIINFNQKPGESLIKAYLRYRSLLDDCPHHTLPSWLVLHFSYGGLSYQHKPEVDHASREAFTDCNVPQAWELLDNIRAVLRLSNWIQVEMED